MVSLWEARQRLRAAGIENYQQEAAWLLQYGQASQLEELLERRCSGEPLQYVLGSWEFFGLEFSVGPGVLIPRQDTETLVELVLDLRRGERQTRLLDLCSGTGCIPIAVEKQLGGVTGDCLEYSLAAVPYLRENLARQGSGIRLWQGDVFQPPAELLEKKYDIITCNPPYLTKTDMGQLQREVQYEPETALYGGTDGLRYYREITPLWKDCLTRGCWLVYEVGMGQSAAVAAILEENDLTECRRIRDLSGIERVVAARHP